MLIRIKQHYFGLNKETVIKLMLVDCETLIPVTQEQAGEEPLSIYFGSTMVNVVGLDENGRTVEMAPQEITFPISASSRIEAFSNFEQSARAYVEYLKEEQSRQHQNNNLYVPNSDEVNRFSKLITP